MTTYTSQPDATDGLDTYINSGFVTTNYGTAIYMTIGNSISATIRGLLKPDLTKGTNPPLPGAVLSSFKITLHVATYNIARTLAFYRCLRAWVESEATWNNWNAGSAWTAAGAASDGNDYSSTLLGSVDVSGAYVYEINMNAAGIAVVQEWVNVPATNCGFVMRHTLETTNYNRYDSSDASGNRPLFSGEYIFGGQFITWQSECRLAKEKSKKYFQGWSFKNGIMQPEMGLSI